MSLAGTLNREEKEELGNDEADRDRGEGEAIGLDDVSEEIPAPAIAAGGANPMGTGGLEEGVDGGGCPGESQADGGLG